MTASTEPARRPKQRKDGNGSVFQRADGRWVAQVRVLDPLTGKSKPVRRYASSRDKARDLLDELRKSPSPAPVSHTRRGVTLADWLQQWSQVNLPRLPIKDTTKQMYGDCLAWYGIPAAGSIQLASFNASAAELWVERVAATRKNVKAVKGQDGAEVRPAGRYGATIAASSVRNTFQAASRALDTAVRDGLIKSNPLREVERPRMTRAQVPVTRPDEVDALLKACEDRRVEPLAWFVAYTGCRIGEALGLAWSDVDLDAATATIRRSAPGTASTKTETVRTVTLVPDVVGQLKAVRKRQAADRLQMGAGWQATGLVFTSATGRPLDRRNVSHELQRALKAAGVTTARPWHSLRHGLAHRLIHKGVPLPMVSGLLGHSSIAVTVDVYGHLDAAIPADVLAEAIK